jgi:hypothetical protein
MHQACFHIGEDRCCYQNYTLCSILMTFDNVLVYCCYILFLATSALLCENAVLTNITGY